MAVEGSKYPTKKSICLAAFQKPKYPPSRWWTKTIEPNSVTWEIRAANGAQLWSWYDGLSPAEKTAEPASTADRADAKREAEEEQEEEVRGIYRDGTEAQTPGGGSGGGANSGGASGGGASQWRWRWRS
jgi:hypothetical protein